MPLKSPPVTGVQAETPWDGLCLRERPTGFLAQAYKHGEAALEQHGGTVAMPQEHMAIAACLVERLQVQAQLAVVDGIILGAVVDVRHLQV